jgi:hypothetical protein
MNWTAVCEELLHAETEAEVSAVLKKHDLLREALWVPLGGEENNFSIVSNQHGDATGALVEKMINAIDAQLLWACFARGIDPEGPEAPATMAQAVAGFYDVPGGRLGELTAAEQAALANGIRLVAVGSKSAPNYLVIDTGEAQTPSRFPDTFMSVAKSNKLRIPFVQGKYNAGGTGVLQFCGQENYQLIVSRRHPGAPVVPGDTTADLWGFTLVRRVRPHTGDNRRSSMYVYLAPDGSVPTFSADAIRVLPRDRQKEPAVPYAEPLEHGTVIKLYEYKWRAKSIATTEARFELEKYLHAPCLPFRITETRPYTANYFSTTFSGIWASIDAEAKKERSDAVEAGFPASALLDLPETGTLPYSIVVFTPERAGRRTPKGVYFTINGQVHGQAPADFVSRRLKYEYLKDELFVSVDCTGMREDVREDFFMASRDRLRKNETYDMILKELEVGLRDHPGLAQLNSARRAKQIEKALDEQEDVLETFQQLLRADPSLRALFNLGDRLVTSVGPTAAEKFKGRRFPTFFRIKNAPKGGVVKRCPINRSCRLEFETDAENDYFNRANSPGVLTMHPEDVHREHDRLWNGDYTARFRPPEGSKPGDVFEVRVVVTDPERDGNGKPPFENSFRLEVTKAEDRTTKPGKPRKPKAPDGGKNESPRLSMPEIVQVRKEDWQQYGMTEYDALKVKSDGQDGHDFYLNMDNPYLLTELARVNGEADKDLVRYWFKWGLAIAALGQMRHLERANGSNNGSNNGDADAASMNGHDPLDLVNMASSGLASVIIPVIRTLNRGDQARV